MIDNFPAGSRLNKRSVWLVMGSLLSLLLLLSACDPGPPARGPQSAPIERVSMARFDLATSEHSPLAIEDFHAALQNLGDSVGLGLDVALLKAQPSDPNFDLLLVTLNVEHYSARLVEPGVASNQLSGLDLIQGRAGSWLPARGLMLGSFFVAGFAPLEPLGLLQVNGREIGTLQPHGYTRILGVGRDGLGVVHRGAFHRGLFESAIQVGPGIVESGELDINETERRLPTYLRSFVGACGDRALLGVSFARLHLYDVGQRLQAWLADQDFTCDEVANLSGDRETLLVVPEPGGNSLLVYGDLDAPKTALLGFQGPPPTNAVSQPKTQQ